MSIGKPWIAKMRKLALSVALDRAYSEILCRRNVPRFSSESHPARRRNICGYFEERRAASSRKDRRACGLWGFRISSQRRGAILAAVLLAVSAVALAFLVIAKFSANVSAQVAQNDLPTPQNPVVAKIIDPFGIQTNIQPLIVISNNQLHISVPEPKSSFRPGKYKLNLWIWRNGIIYYTENDFTWGVLAVNFNKSIYALGDQVKAGFAVLNDGGRTLCGAAIDMSVFSPSGGISSFSTANKTISKNSTCGPGTVTNEPDYSVEFPARETGTYNVSVSAKTANGTRKILDSFEVQAPPLFDVERHAPTRIFPPSPYNVSITVKANEDFSGNITETVPASFNVTAAGAGKTYTHDTQTLSWSVNMKKGDALPFAYSFKAPDVSPELYKLGPLQIGNWSEARQWQVAADAISNTVIFITSTSSITWTVPGDWNNSSNTIELIGGGGSGHGGQARVSSSGNAGGGGAYAEISNFSTSSGNPISIQVGRGAFLFHSSYITYFNWNGSGATTTCNSLTMSVCAAYGSGGLLATNGHGVGGSVAHSVGTIIKAGGNGGEGQFTAIGEGGGGGGGAGGPNGSGSIGGTSSGTAPTGGSGGGGNGGGSAGGAGGADGGAGGNNFGGSGGGAGGVNSVGGNGSNGGGGGGGDGTAATGGAFAGGNGATSTQWTQTSDGATAGPGGGGGGGGGDTNITSGDGGNGGTPGDYGGGAGGGGSCAASSTSCTTGPIENGAQGIIVITYTPTTITLADGTEPAGATIGPGANATTSAVFSLVTNNGTSSITSVSVNVATTTGVFQVQVTDSSGATVFGSSTNPASQSLTINTSGMNVSTTITMFQTAIVPLNATSMPTTPISGFGAVGGTYVVTSTVTSFVDNQSLPHAGSNTTSSPVTIDNLSPADVTNSSGTAGSGQVVFTWTNPSDTDFATTTVLRATSSISVAPTEGVYYTVGQAINMTTTVACVVASSTSGCTDSGLTNGVTYYYMIFTADNFLNYSSGTVPAGNPFTPTAVGTNNPPSISGVSLNHGSDLVLTPNATTSFDINYTITDSNGCGDITTNVTSTAFRTGVFSTCGASPTTSSLSCYLSITHTTSTCSGTSVTATDTVAIYFFANSTGNGSSTYPTQAWEAFAQEADGSNATGSATSTNVNVDVLSAVNVTTSSINYGTVTASTTSAEQIATTTNAGNSTTSIQLYALSTLACSAGGCNGTSISTSSQHYASSTGIAFDNSIALTASPITLTGITLQTPTSTSNVSTPTFWILDAPAGTATGTFSGTNVFSPTWSP